MTAPRPRSPQQPKQLNARTFQAEISSFALRLAAEGKRQDDPDLHRGSAVVRRRSPARAGRPGQLGAGGQPGHPAVDDMAAGPVQQRLRQQPVPGPAAVLQVAARRRRAARPDGRAAAAARYRQAGDIDLWQREITVRGKGGKDRIVRIGHQTARSLDRYLRARSRHAQAWRPRLWLGAGNREPLTAAGICRVPSPQLGTSSPLSTPLYYLTSLSTDIVCLR